VTLSVPIPGDLTASNCPLRLLDNSIPLPYEFMNASNGTYQVKWNTLFASLGRHLLQVRLGSASYGPLVLFTNANPVQIDLWSTVFGTQICLQGTFPSQSVDYHVKFFDPQGNLVKTIAWQHTDVGTLDLIWNLQRDDGQLDTNKEYTAVIYAGGGDQANALSRTSRLAQKAPTPKDPWASTRIRRVDGGIGDQFEVAAGFDDAEEQHKLLEQTVQSALCGDTIVRAYDSTPLMCVELPQFWMNNADKKWELTNDICNWQVGNFFWHGHADPNNFGPVDPEPYNERHIPTPQMVNALELCNLFDNRNHSGQNAGLGINHPFRLVIIEGCKSAEKGGCLPLAFGMPDFPCDTTWYHDHGLSPQAYVGWEPYIYYPSFIQDQVETDQWTNYGKHWNDVFDCWMNGATLEASIKRGTRRYNRVFGREHDWPLDSHYAIYGDGSLLREWAGAR
jgi:hypothetical protein